MARVPTIGALRLVLSLGRHSGTDAAAGQAYQPDSHGTPADPDPPRTRSEGYRRRQSNEVRLGIALALGVFVLGAKRLPELSRSLGQALTEFKKGLTAEAEAGLVSRNLGDRGARDDVGEQRQREQRGADPLHLHDVGAAIKNVEPVVAAGNAADPMKRDLIREQVHGSRLIHLHEDFREP